MDAEETLPNRELQKILYVDDDEDMRLIVEIALTAIGKFTAEICPSWPQAREKLDSFSPDLILLDLIMPDVDGLAALDDLRKASAWRHIPVVFLTAHLQPTGLSDYRDLNILGIVGKPFKPKQLRSQLLDLWHSKEGRMR